jgi:hypothetical protein
MMPRGFQIDPIPTSVSQGPTVEARPPNRPDQGGIVGQPGTATQHAELRWTSDSSPLFFDTMFDDLDLEATPVYNRYVPNETYHEYGQDYQVLSDLPRYVLLTWRKAPILQVGRTFVPVVGTRGSLVGGIRNTSEAPTLAEVEQMVQRASNGAVETGVIDLRVAPLSSAQERGNAVDEELYLSDHTLAGVPIAHLSSNIIDERPQTVTYDDLGSTARPAGKVRPDSLTAVRAPESTAKDAQPRVRLTSTSLAGVLMTPRPADTREHLESLGSLAAVAPELGLMSATPDVLSQDPSTAQGAPALPGGPELAYVGYVIEKQRLLGGQFVSMGQLVIEDRDTDSFVDTAVVYQGVYRYRIRAVLRWNHPSNVQLLPGGVPPQLSSTSGQVTHVFMGAWSPYDSACVMDLSPPSPPDEVRLRPSSGRGSVQVSWKLPDDPQDDIDAIYVHRRTVRGDVFLDEWRTLAGPLPVENGYHVDQDVQVFQDIEVRYVYALTATSLHGERSVLSEQLTCRLNPEHMYEGEAPVRQISAPGASLTAHGAMSVIPYRRDQLEVVAHDTAVVYASTGPSRLVNQDADLVVRLESLDTGQVRDITLDLNFIPVQSPSVDAPRMGRVPVQGGPRTTFS